MNQKSILLFCMLLTPFVGLGMDLYTPSLPAITHFFHVSDFQAKLTIILYVATFGVTQPFAGIISDQMERKSFVFIALTGYVISALASALAPTIQVLYVLRIINSMCATSIAVVIKSIILDHFSGKSLAKANNYFTLSWSVTPMIAPVIGGYLQHYLNWQANFIFMGLCPLFVLPLCFKVFKNYPKHTVKKNKLSFQIILQRWRTLFSDRFFVAAIVILAVENTILFLYYTAAPFIIQQNLHFTAAQYGNVMLFAGLSYVIGNVINSRLLNYFSIEKIVAIGLIISLIMPLFPIVIMFFTHNHFYNIYMVTLPIFIIFMCDGLIFSNIATKSLSSYAQFSGIAGGLLAGAFNLLAAIIVGLCAHWLNLHNVVTLNMTYFIAFFISCFIFFVWTKPILR